MNKKMLILFLCLAVYCVFPISVKYEKSPKNNKCEIVGIISTADNAIIRNKTNEFQSENWIAQVRFAFTVQNINYALTTAVLMSLCYSVILKTILSYIYKIDGKKQNHLAFEN